MNKQTENYIILKPIAERFNRIAKSITDDEIKSLIKNELRNQINKECKFGEIIAFVFNEWMEDENNIATINEMFKKSIQDKLR